jgi:hypothetical protein
VTTQFSRVLVAVLDFFRDGVAKAVGAGQLTPELKEKASKIRMLPAAPSGPQEISNSKPPGDEILSALYTPRGTKLQSLIAGLSQLYARSGIDVVLACSDPCTAYWVLNGLSSSTTSLDGHPVRARMYFGSAVKFSPMVQRGKGLAAPQQRSLLYALASAQPYKEFTEAELSDATIRDVCRSALISCFTQPEEQIMQLQQEDTVSPSRQVFAALLDGLLTPGGAQASGTPRAAGTQSPPGRTPFCQPPPPQPPAPGNAEAEALQEQLRQIEAQLLAHQQEKQ